jgi:transposase
LLQEHHHELWIGDAAEIRAAMVRKQKTDRRDACHILDLLLTNRFPRIWMPSPAERDLRQMLRHRHKLVRFRTSVKNQMHALAMGQGLCRRKKLWARVGRQELENLVLDPWSSRRRTDLLQLLARVRCRRTSSARKPGVEIRYCIAALSFDPLCGSFLTQNPKTRQFES